MVSVIFRRILELLILKRFYLVGRRAWYSFIFSEFFRGVGSVFGRWGSSCLGDGEV